MPNKSEGEEDDCTCVHVSKLRRRLSARNTLSVWLVSCGRAGEERSKLEKQTVYGEIRGTNCWKDLFFFRTTNRFPWELAQSRGER